MLRFRELLAVASLCLAACGGGGGGEPAVLAELPGNAFATDSILVVASELTPQSLVVLSVDSDSGAVGLMPDSPADVGITITDAETLEAYPPRRRVFFGSNLTGRIAVFDIDASGAAEPAIGSPFDAEAIGVSVIKVAADGSSIYVGYHGESFLSRYDVANDGVLTLAQSVSTGTHSHVETMLLVEEVLYVGFAGSSSIVGYRLDAQGAFEVGPAAVDEVVTETRPDYLVRIGARLYCSLADNGTVDAFDIEGDGSLTRLSGAPYAYPGIGQFELIAVRPGGDRIAVGAERPYASVGLYTVEADGSLTPDAMPLKLSNQVGGPEGMAFSDDGGYLYVCDHIAGGLFVIEVGDGLLGFATPARIELPGKQIDVVRLDIAVIPNEGSALLRIATEG